MGLRSVLLVESGIKKKKSLNITLNGHILGHISKPPCWPKDNMNGNGVSIQAIYRGNNQKRFKKEENEKEKKRVKAT